MFTISQERLNVCLQPPILSCWWYIYIISGVFDRDAFAPGTWRMIIFLRWRWVLRWLLVRSGIRLLIFQLEPHGTNVTFLGGDYKFSSSTAPSLSSLFRAGQDSIFGMLTWNNQWSESRDWYKMYYRLERVQRLWYFLVKNYIFPGR